jgi:penicillin-binding protein 1A
VRLQVPLRVYSRDRRVIAQIGEYRRIPVSYDDIPERVRQAFLPPRTTVSSTTTASITPD